ncbi:MAG: glycosyltransferase [Candidatus Methylomirabilis oxyfera]|nr:glycosyltransferase [Candidatus Methylomirabilis oxyfera]
MNADGHLISIVTPCLNRRQFIEEAIQSVVRQDYPDVEHIIVDGGSTDGTLEVLRRYPHLRVISERDRSLFDALNKGIGLARGEILGHLNSDDFYRENVFAQVARRFAADPHIDVVYGEATVFEQRADGTRRTVAHYSAPRDIEMSFYNITIGVPIINARFFRRRVYEQVGLYDMHYRIAADRDFLLRVALAGARSESLGCLVYHYRQHHGSLSISGQGVQRRKMLSEHLKIAERYLQADGVSSQARHYCRLWHAREAMVGILLALRQMRFGEAVRYGRRVWRYDTTVAA